MELFIIEGEDGWWESKGQKAYLFKKFGYVIWAKGQSILAF